MESSLAEVQVVLAKPEKKGGQVRMRAGTRSIPYTLQPVNEMTAPTALCPTYAFAWRNCVCVD